MLSTVDNPRKSQIPDSKSSTKPFKNLTFYLDIMYKNKHNAQSLIEIIESNGGTIAKKLCPKIDYIIFSRGFNSTLQYALSNNIKVVDFLWLHDKTNNIYKDDSEYFINKTYTEIYIDNKIENLKRNVSVDKKEKKRKSLNKGKKSNDGQEDKENNTKDNKVRKSFIGKGYKRIESYFKFCEGKDGEDSSDLNAGWYDIISDKIELLCSISFDNIKYIGDISFFKEGEGRDNLNKNKKINSKNGSRNKSKNKSLGKSKDKSKNKRESKDNFNISVSNFLNTQSESMIETNNLLINESNSNNISTIANTNNNTDNKLDSISTNNNTSTLSKIDLSKLSKSDLDKHIKRYDIVFINNYYDEKDWLIVYLMFSNILVINIDLFCFEYITTQNKVDSISILNSQNSNENTIKLSDLKDISNNNKCFNKIKQIQKTANNIEVTEKIFNKTINKKFNYYFYISKKHLSDIEFFLSEKIVKLLKGNFLNNINDDSYNCIRKDDSNNKSFIFCVMGNRAGKKCSIGEDKEDTYFDDKINIFYLFDSFYNGEFIDIDGERVTIYKA